MSDCMGEVPISTKVDASMREFVEDEAHRLGVSRAEFLRRLLDHYRQSQNEEETCPECEEPIIMSVQS